ncbi:MAG TPA: hypothetical protein VFH78_11825 [Candidatus Thermoplasmatota archaeon]|nr:hypothetical protein [Candidatus Thermoplasmatota archaeon]
MRAAVLVLALLAAAPAVHAAAPYTVLAHRYMDTAGWWSDSFELVGSNNVRITFAVRSHGEVVGNILALYDDTGRLLRGTTYFSVGGQVVETALSPSGGVHLTNEGIGATAAGGVFERTVTWTCDAACNPSRKFKLAVTAGGDVEEWGFGIITQGGAVLTQPLHGFEAGAFTTRHFEGQVAHVASPFAGVHVARETSLTASADDMMLATFVKPSATAPRLMRVDGPTSGACPCFGGNWPAGDYTFRYDDVDARGVEGYLTFADVRLP